MKNLFLLFLSFNAMAQFEYRGQLELRSSKFESDKNQDTFDEQNSFYTKLETNYEKDNLRINLSGFARFDSMDKSRKVSTLDEAYLKYSGESFSVSVGNHVFNWSVLEFFHPVDTINSRNLDVNAERIERLGLTSVVLNKDFKNSYLQFIYLLENTDPIIPKKSNRNGFGIDLDRPQYVQTNGEVSSSPKYDQYGIRYKHSFESFDLDLHWMRKAANNTPFIGIPVQVITDPNTIEVSPFYFPLTQIGVTLQYVWDDFLLKLESRLLDFDALKVDILIPTNSIPPVAASKLFPVDHTQNAIGLEYTKHYNNNHEGTFFGEYQVILNTTHENARNLNPFQRDIGVGYRHNFNDFNSNAFVIALIHDIESGNETLYNIEHSFSFNQHYKMYFNMRIIDAPKAKDQFDSNGLKPLRDADNFCVAVTRFF